MMLLFAEKQLTKGRCEAFVVLFKNCHRLMFSGLPCVALDFFGQNHDGILTICTSWLTKSRCVFKMIWKVISVADNSELRWSSETISMKYKKKICKIKMPHWESIYGKYQITWTISFIPYKWRFAISAHASFMKDVPVTVHEDKGGSEEVNARK